MPFQYDEGSGTWTYNGQDSDWLGTVAAPSLLDEAMRKRQQQNQDLQVKAADAYATNAGGGLATATAQAAPQPPANYGYYPAGGETANAQAQAGPLPFTPAAPQQEGGLANAQAFAGPANAQGQEIYGPPSNLAQPLTPGQKAGSEPIPGMDNQRTGLPQDPLAYYMPIEAPGRFLPNLLSVAGMHAGPEIAAQLGAGPTVQNLAGLAGGIAGGGAGVGANALMEGFRPRPPVARMVPEEPIVPREIPPGTPGAAQYREPAPVSTPLPAPAWTSRDGSVNQYQVGEHLVQVDQRSPTALHVSTERMGAAVGTEVDPMGLDAFTSRSPGGSVAGLRQVAEFLDDLATANPEKRILFDPTDARRNATYSRISDQLPDGMLQLNQERLHALLNREPAPAPLPRAPATTGGGVPPASSEPAGAGSAPRPPEGAVHLLPENADTPAQHFRIMADEGKSVPWQDVVSGASHADDPAVAQWARDYKAWIDQQVARLPEPVPSRIEQENYVPRSVDQVLKRGGDPKNESDWVAPNKVTEFDRERKGRNFNEGQSVRYQNPEDTALAFQKWVDGKVGVETTAPVEAPPVGPRGLSVTPEGLAAAEAARSAPVPEPKPSQFYNDFLSQRRLNGIPGTIAIDELGRPVTVQAGRGAGYPGSPENPTGGRGGGPRPPSEGNEGGGVWGGQPGGRGGGATPPDTRNIAGRAVDEIGGILGLPQTASTALDFSGLLRQAAVMGVRHPLITLEGTARAIKAATSEERWLALDRAVRENPYFEQGRAAGLHTYEVGPGVAGTERAGGFTGLNRSFVSRAAETIPGIRQSERGLAGLLNWQGMKVFEKWAKAAEDRQLPNVRLYEELKAAERTRGLNEGEQRIIADMENMRALDVKEYQALAKVINHARGYGDWSLSPGRGFAPFFSGRNLTSRFQVLLDPFTQPGSLLQPSARQLAATNLASFVGANLALLGLINEVGQMTGTASVEFDPRSTDWGKIKIGNLRIDPWAGFAPIARLIARGVTGETKTSTGRIGNADAVGEVTRFFRNKESPVASLITDIVSGKDWKGAPIVEGDEGGLPKTREQLTERVQGRLTPQQAARMFTPFIIQDTVQAYRTNEGNQAITGLAGAATFFGAGANSYEPYRSQAAQDRATRMGLTGPEMDKIQITVNPYFDQRNKMQETQGQNAANAWALQYLQEHPEVRDALRQGGYSVPSGAPSFQPRQAGPGQLPFTPGQPQVGNGDLPFTPRDPAQPTYRPAPTPRTRSPQPIPQYAKGGTIKVATEAAKRPKRMVRNVEKDKEGRIIRVIDKVGDEVKRTRTVLRDKRGKIDQIIDEVA